MWRIDPAHILLAVGSECGIVYVWRFDLPIAVPSSESFAICGPEIDLSSDKGNAVQAAKRPTVSQKKSAPLKLPFPSDYRRVPPLAPSSDTDRPPCTLIASFRAAGKDTFITSLAFASQPVPPPPASQTSAGTGSAVNGYGLMLCVGDSGGTVGLFRLFGVEYAGDPGKDSASASASKAESKRKRDAEETATDAGSGKSSSSSNSSANFGPGRFYDLRSEHMLSVDSKGRLAPYLFAGLQSQVVTCLAWRVSSLWFPVVAFAPVRCVTQLYPCTTRDHLIQFDSFCCAEYPFTHRISPFLCQRM